MNEKQYFKLCKECDELLVAEDATFERICISWLHIIREHPVFLKKYKKIFQSSCFFKESSQQFILKLKNYLSLLKQFGLAFISGNKPWYRTLGASSEKTDVLFLSHVLNKDQINKSDDYYFGSLPNELKQKNVTVVIALINHTNISAKKLTYRWNEKTIPRIIFTRTLNIISEVEIWLRLKRETKLLGMLSKCQQDEFKKKIYKSASTEALSAASRANLRISFQIEDVVKNIKPKVIITTYEGHSWERVAYAAARRVLPNAMIVGYQHSMIFRFQHAIRRKLKPEYNPSLIFTSGEVSKRQLEKTSGLNGIPISILGSNHSKIIKNQTNKKVRINNRSREMKAVLVIPEGIESECHVLINFSLECAKIYPEILFIWRFHPLIVFEDLIKANPKLKSLPDNILVSKNTLDEDIGKCKWAMYRGSTAIVKSVLYGLIPIYLEIKNEMTINPLYELSKHIKKINSVSDLESYFEPNSDCKHIINQDHIKHYCKNIFQTYKPNKILECVLK